MILIPPLADVQERPHPGSHIPATPPDQPYPCLHRRVQGDPHQLRQLLKHASVEETAALALPDEFQDGDDLAAAHDDMILKEIDDANKTKDVSSA